MIEHGYLHVSTAGDQAVEGVAGNGVRWAIYDTYCKSFGPEEKSILDRRLTDIIIRAEHRKRLESINKEVDGTE